MKRILLATDYPNLTELKIYYFKQDIALDYFTNESSLRSIFQEQITNLTLINDDKDEMIRSLENYTTNDKLFNLKCFSLKSFFRFKQYDKILSLLRRMSNLEKLTLYLPIEGRNRVIDGTYVQHDILDHMPQLHSFTFYICTYVETVDLSYKLSSEDIQQTLTNIGQQHAINLGNKFPNIVFSYVTHLLVQDTDPFEHEFFMRIARSFPLLKHLRIINVEPQDKLFNLKCFSLKSFFRFKQYDKIVSLLRRMPNLEKLTLYLPIEDRNTVIDGTYVQHDILDYMPQLHSFTFYICTYVKTVDLSYKLSSEDIQQTLTNIGQEHVTSIVNYIQGGIVACSIFSLPFEFDYLKYLGNKFPNIVFNYVTFLLVEDTNPFKHEFFIRIGRSFPLLKYLRIFNSESQVLDGLMTFSSDNCQLHPIIEYFHLTRLDVRYAHRDYVEQFLNETKTFIPCLTVFEVDVDDLKAVTKRFTREETRRNCAKANVIAQI
ncbi:unnamed protein product [Rotaria sordida]|uniref:Uncharacterized protein n=1 Tax=Rotaria sordida TaxID=392033 RepID=A0A815F9M1_9BILA|nr:unnamed protein product [Rotaria sordida]